MCPQANGLKKSLIVLFQLMIPAGIPELTSDDDIVYLRDKLALELDDAAAAKQIKKEIKKCLNDYYRLFDNFVVSFFLGRCNIIGEVLCLCMSADVTNCSAPCILCL